MPSANFTCTSCGGQAKVVLNRGTTEQARERAAWLATHGGTCTDCHTAARQAQRAADSLAAQAANADAGLPPLTGTEKQIAWAERLRADMVALVNKQAAAMIERAPNAEAADIVRAAAAKICRQARATYWIDRHNSRDIDGRLRKLVAEALAARGEAGK